MRFPRYVFSAFCMLLCSSAFVYGQPVTESLSKIDWGAVKTDMESTPSGQLEGLRTFRASNASNLDAIRVPVLVPSIGPVRAAPRIKGQGTSYAATYMLNAAKLSIMGSAKAIVPPRPEEFSAAAEKFVGRVFDYGEDGADLSFTKYGASYVLRLSCAKLDDERCTNDKFLNTVAESLIPVGGKE